MTLILPIGSGQNCKESSPQNCWQGSGRRVDALFDLMKDYGIALSQCANLPCTHFNLDLQSGSPCGRTNRRVAQRNEVPLRKRRNRLSTQISFTHGPSAKIHRLQEMAETSIPPDDRTFGSILMACAFTNQAPFDVPIRERAFQIASKTFPRAPKFLLFGTHHAWNECTSSAARPVLKRWFYTTRLGRDWPSGTYAVTRSIMRYNVNSLSVCCLL